MTVTSVFRAASLAVPPCLAALYPLVLILRSHSTTHHFSAEVILRPAAVLVVTALIVLLLFRRLLGNAAAASITATLFFVVMGLFPVVFNARTAPEGLLLPAVFTVAAIVLAALAARFMQGFSALVVSWAIAMVVVWTLISTLLVSAAWSEPPWEDAVERIAAGVWTARLPNGGKKPDIYYIVLDGMGREDVLERLYGIDAEPAIHQIEARGARVPRASRSNYSQTQLSLASAMNMHYLTALGAVMGDAFDRRPLHRLILEGGVMRLLKRHGYEFVVVGSDASITSQHRAADRCLCALPDGPTELEHALLSMTPLRARYFGRAAMAAHGREVVRALDLLESARSDRPMFVMAHIVSPHPPFVLAPDGTVRIGQERFTYLDGDGFPGTRDEYLAGYRMQASFILRRLVTLVERITTRSPGAVIVVHSDHGPGLGLVNSDVSKTDAWERLAIFSIYYSGGGTVVPNDISPVNALRWAMRSGLGADVPLLPNASYLSDYARPYRWHEVPARRADTTEPSRAE